MRKSKTIKRDVSFVNAGFIPHKRICIGTPTTGLVRIEWVMTRFGQIIPCNWSNTDIFQYFDHFAPLNYVVDDAQNVCVQHAIDVGAEWLFLLEEDVMMPNDTFIKLNGYMRSGKIPVISGLYYAKSTYPEPLIYRGDGNSYYDKWKFGDKVWVDGVPTGCLLIHMSLIRAVYNESAPYSVPTLFGPKIVRKVFVTPQKSKWDPEKFNFAKQFGTSDLNWCRRVREEKFLEKAGWPEYQKKRYPFLIDTSIFCQQIDQQGNQYPGNLYKYTKQWKDSPMEREERQRLKEGRKEGDVRTRQKQTVKRTS